MSNATGFRFVVVVFSLCEVPLLFEALGCRQDMVLLATSAAMQTPDQKSSRPSQSERRRTAISWILPVAMLGTMLACAAAARDFLQANMDPSVDPSDDFFTYANGGWLRRHPIPASEAGWGIGNVVREELYARLIKGAGGLVFLAIPGAQRRGAHFNRRFLRRRSVVVRDRRHAAIQLLDHGNGNGTATRRSSAAGRWAKGVRWRRDHVDIDPDLNVGRILVLVFVRVRLSRG